MDLMITTVILNDSIHIFLTLYNTNKSKTILIINKNTCVFIEICIVFFGRGVRIAKYFLSSKTRFLATYTAKIRR